jgi:uncharacterized membrane protein
LTSHLLANFGVVAPPSGALSSTMETSLYKDGKFHMFTFVFHVYTMT